MLNQINPDLSLPSHYLKIHFNISLQPGTVSCKLFLSFSFSRKKFVCIYLLPRACHVTFILITTKHSVSASQKTHCISIRETENFGLFREIIDRNLLSWRCEKHMYTARAVFRHNLANTGLWSHAFLSVPDHWTALVTRWVICPS